MRISEEPEVSKRRRSDISSSADQDNELDILTSNLSRKLRVSPKKKRKSNNMMIDDTPIKQRLRKSIKKRTSSGDYKIIPRELWSTK